MNLTLMEEFFWIYIKTIIKFIFHIILNIMEIWKDVIHRGQ